MRKFSANRASRMLAIFSTLVTLSVTATPVDAKVVTLTNDTTGIIDDIMFVFSDGTSHDFNVASTKSGATVTFDNALLGPFLKNKVTLSSYEFTYKGKPVGPINGVPEPSTWVMMLLGLAGLGFAGYFRTRNSRMVSLAG